MSLAPRWVKVIRDLWSNKSRTLLVVLSIAIGAFAAGVIINSKTIIGTRLDEGFFASNPANVILYTDPFTDDLIKAVQHMKGVSDAEGRRRLRVKVQLGSRANSGAPWKSIELYALPDYHDLRVDKFNLDQGNLPPARGQVFLERSSAQSIKGRNATVIGRQLTIELADGRQRSLTIAGQVHDVTNMPPIFQGSMEGFVSRDTLEKLGESRLMNEIRVTFKHQPKDKAEARVAAEVIRKKLERGGLRVWYVYTPDQGKHPAAFVVDAFMVILGAMGALSLFLSGFLVVNTITALLIQQTRQIGILKAIGATGWQVSSIYFGMVGLLGILAFLVAIPTSAVATRLFTDWTAHMLNFDRAPSGFVPLGLIVMALVSLFVPLAAAAIPIISGTRVSVREAINFTGIAENHGNGDLISRLLGAIKRIPRPIVLALRNTFRRKGRLTLTLITLALGGAVFAGVMSTRHSLYTTMEDAFKYWNYDISLNLSQKYPLDRLITEAKRVPGVLAAESWNFRSVKRVRKDGSESNTYLTVGLPPKTAFISPKLVSGRWLVSGDETGIVINTSVVRNEPDLKPGSKVRLKIDTKEAEFTVVGVVRGVMNGSTIYVNQDWFAGFIGESERARSVNVITSQHSADYQKMVADALEAHYKGAGIKVSSRDELTADTRIRIGKQFDMLVSVLIVMALLVSSVGGLGLAGTMGMNVLERTKEIGVMRAIGASDGTVVLIFVLEGLVIGVISWALGVVCSLPIGQLLSNAVGMNFMQAPLSYSFSVSGAILWLGLSILLSVTASILPARKASQITVRDVLAYEG